jgi:hypothetical protein
MRSSGENLRHRRSACITREADGMADAPVRQPRRSFVEHTDVCAVPPVAPAAEKRVSASRARAAPDAEADAVVRERYQAFMCTQILLSNLVRLPNPPLQAFFYGACDPTAAPPLRATASAWAPCARVRSRRCAANGRAARAYARWRQRAGCSGSAAPPPR